VNGKFILEKNIFAMLKINKVEKIIKSITHLKGAI
jgi:hypothetical protein